MHIRITRRRLLFAAILCICVFLICVELYFLSADVRSIAVGAAERLGADEFLVARLADHDLQVRGHAREALVRRGAKAVPALVGRLSDADPGNRSSAAATLARIGPAAAEAIPDLLKCAVEDEDEGVLESAGEALGRVARGRPETVLKLLAMLKSPVDSNRLAAIRAAACLDDARAVQPLIESLSHANAKIREEAAEALGEIGSESVGAISALIERLGDPSPAVRGESREAIMKIIKNAKGESGASDHELITNAERALEKAGFGQKNFRPLHGK